MPTQTFKILGQLNPAATSLTTLYTTPAATQTTISTLTVCNESASGVTFRVAVIPSGGSIDPKSYLYYDQALNGNTTFAATLGITLAAGDIMQVYASSTALAFNLFGVEVS